MEWGHPQKDLGYHMGPDDEPPAHLMPDVFPKAGREGKYELINLIDGLVLDGIETLQDN